MSRGPLQILLIDDDPLQFDIINEFLRLSEGRTYQLSWAKSERQAETFLQSNHFDALLVDYFLEGAYGTRLIQKISKDQENIPIILLTASNDRTIDVEAMSSGASDFLVKSELTPTLLERSIRYAICQKEHEEQMRITTLQLAHAEKMQLVGTLASGVAHNFNNLLLPIIGFTEMVRDQLDPNSPEFRKQNLVLKAANRAKYLINQILAFSRKAPLNLKPVILSHLVRDSISFLRSTIPSSIQIHEHLQNDCSYILGDESIIQQLLLNLCINASHAMPQGGDLSLGVKENAFHNYQPHEGPTLSGKFVTLSVEDTGCGISPETLKHIFQPFFTTKEPGRGTGLGLAAIIGRMSQFNGGIDVQSVVDQGTTFSLHFPAVLDMPISTAPTTEKVPNSLLKPINVLYAEDEETVRAFLCEYLNEIGCHVTSTFNGQEALNLFKSNPGSYDIIITDYMMPKMTGLRLATAVREIVPDFPIILCTGYSELSWQKNKLKPVDKILQKPFSPLHLQQAINDLFNQS